MKNSKAILQVPGTMKIISAEIPVPKEDEVLIKVRICRYLWFRCTWF